MSARPYHKRYHSDALSGFMALTLEERGAYQTLLDMMYDRQGPILDNERLLAGYMQTSIRKWRLLRASLIEKGKIYSPEDGLLFNFRVKKELENDAKTARKLSENGSKGGRKKVENEKEDNENNGAKLAKPKPPSSLNQKPETRNQNSVTKVTGASPPEDPAKVLFDLGVSILTKAGRTEQAARSMVGRWRNSRGDAATSAALVEARDKTDPIAWIEGRFAAGDRQDDALYASIDRKYRRAANA